MKNTNSNVSLATNIDGSVGNTGIAEIWKCHYKFLLSSVQNNELKNSVKSNINKQHPNFIIMTPFNVSDALKDIKCSKSCGS